MKDIKTKLVSKRPKVLNRISRLPRDTRKETDTHDIYTNPESYATDRITQGMSDASQKSLRSIKYRAKQLMRKGRRAGQTRDESFDEQSEKTDSSGFHEPNTEQAPHSYHQEARERTSSTGNFGVRARKTQYTDKPAQEATGYTRRNTKVTIKEPDNRIKTTNKTVKASTRTVKTSAQAAKTAAKTVKTTAKTAKMSAQAAKNTARAAAKGVKLAVKAATAAIKAIAAAVRSLIAAIAAGGWIVLLIVIVVGAFLMVLNSAFGIFYSNEPMDSSGMTMPQVVDEINSEFNASLDRKVAEASSGYENVSVVYDNDSDLDSDSVNNWADVLGIYAVKTTTDATKPMEVATLTEDKKKMIRDLFYGMNSVAVNPVTKLETITVKDDEGNETEETVEKTYLYVNMSSEDYADAAKRYAFTDQQMSLLNELMSPENYPLFAQLTGVDYYGGLTSEDLKNIISNLPAGTKGAEIVKAALTRLGDPYSMAKRGSGNYVDCSYLAKWAYIQAGVSIPSTSVSQAKYCYDNGYAVGQSELQPGDLIFWSKTSCHCGRWHEIHHVGIYIGNKKVIEASSSKGRVVIRELWGLNGGTWQVYMFARPHD